jgi:hypothetical protein
VHEQRFLRDLDAAVVPQSRGRRAVTRFERTGSCARRTTGTCKRSSPPTLNRDAGAIVSI